MISPTKQEIPELVQTSMTQQAQNTQQNSAYHLIAKDISEEATSSATFPSFSKLPQELQDLIWGFALFPQVIRLDLEGGNTVENETWEDYSRILSPKILKCALLELCQSSRKIAGRNRGEKYVIVSRFYHLEPSTARTSPTVHFRPLEDTIYLPERKTLLHMACYTAIGKEIEQSELGEKAGRVTGLNDVRSLAIGGLLQRIIPERPGEVIYGVSYHQHPRKATGGISMLFNHYPFLEELILVSPTIEELSAQASKIREETSGALCQIFSDNVSENRRQVDYYLNKIAISLRMEGESLMKAQQDPHSQERRYSKISHWWKDPVITWMTEAEFESRFGLKPGSGHFKP